MYIYIYTHLYLNLQSNGHCCILCAMGRNDAYSSSKSVTFCILHGMYGKILLFLHLVFFGFPGSLS